jgi:hypothetical protein
VATTNATNGSLVVAIDRQLYETQSVANPWINAHGAGIAMVHVLAQSRPNERRLTEARYLLVPVVVTLMQALLEVMERPLEAAPGTLLAAYIDWVLEWLPAREIDASLVSCRDRMIPLLREIRDRLGPLRAAIFRRDARLLRRVRTDIAQRTNAFQAIHAELRLMYP